MQASSKISAQKDCVVSYRSPSPSLRVAFPPSPVASEKSSSLRVARALEVLRESWAGDIQKAWSVLNFEEGDYSELWCCIKRDVGLLAYVESKVHLDYDSQRLQLVIRMPSLIHEHLLAVIEGEIISQLITIRTSNGPAALLAGQIESYRSSTIYLEDESRRDPDSQFIHEAAKYPGVVIEVAYTQSGKNLSKLADHYIVESSGKISMVIGLSVDYQGSKKATISIWYPMYGVDEDGVFLASEEILSEEFRREDGSAVAEKTLRLPLRHFVPSNVTNLDISTLEIIVPYEKLALSLGKAEARQHGAASHGVFDVQGVAIRKRRRNSTPPEELKSDDERTFKRMESAEDRRVDEGDQDWKKM